MIGQIRRCDLESGCPELVEHVDSFFVERRREAQEVDLFGVTEELRVLLGTEAIELLEAVKLASIRVVGFDPVARSRAGRYLPGFVGLEFDGVGAGSLSFADERLAELEVAIVINASLGNDECWVAFSNEPASKINLFCLHQG